MSDHVIREPIQRTAENDGVRAAAAIRGTGRFRG